MLLNQSGDVTERVTSQVKLSARQFSEFPPLYLRSRLRPSQRVEPRTSLLNDPEPLRAGPSRRHRRHLCQQIVDLEQLTSSPTRRAHSIRTSADRQPGSYR
jgi:hypothetical protein